MRWSYFSQLFDLAVWGGDMVGSSRIEFLLPDDDMVHSMEYWAIQQERDLNALPDDPDLWDVVAVKGTYPKDAVSSSGGISVFNKSSDFIAENQTFEQVAEILESVGAHIRHPQTGFYLDKPEGYLGRRVRENEAGIQFRKVSGVQKNVTRHPEYAVIRERQHRLDAADLG